MRDNLDDAFFLEADKFFYENRGEGLTYNDVSLATLYSEVLPRETSLMCELSEKLRLNIPIISSDMDTVTECKMAIKMALNGGMGLIHYNMSGEQQLKEVGRVKNFIHGLIQDPITVKPDVYIQEVLDWMEKKYYNFKTFPVVDEKNKLLGLLPSKALTERYKNLKVRECMKPLDKVGVIEKKLLGKNPIETANRFFTKNVGAHKLLVVREGNYLEGLFTLSDIDRINEESQLMIKSARDEQFRLVCGVAVGIPKNMEDGEEKKRFLEHIENLIKVGVDAIAISSAHGYSNRIGEAVKMVRGNFKGVDIIAGNVTSGDGVEYLGKMGANIIKVGQGPGSICTTRIVAGVGIPQLTALYVTSKVGKKKGVKILADGGITKSGDIVKALTLADGVVCGNLLAGSKESPGKLVEMNGKFYKQYRGMGSLEAMRAGSAARYGHDRKDYLIKATSEGVEGFKEASGSVTNILKDLIGGIQSGLGYLGAKDLNELKKKARYIKVTGAGQKESGTHDIIEVRSLPS